MYDSASMVAQMVKNLPVMWETWVLSLGWEDPLKKEMATCSNILAWKILWMEEPVGQAIVNGVAKSQTPLSTHVHAHIHTHVCVHILHTHIISCHLYD